MPMKDPEARKQKQKEAMRVKRTGSQGSQGSHKGSQKKREPKERDALHDGLAIALGSAAVEHVLTSLTSLTQRIENMEKHIGDLEQEVQTLRQQKAVAPAKTTGMGYQPEIPSKLDHKDPPRGGSGVPANSRKGLVRQPNYKRPECLGK